MGFRALVGPRCPMHPYPKPPATIRVGARLYCRPCGISLVMFLRRIGAIAAGIVGAKRKKAAS